MCCTRAEIRKLLVIGSGANQPAPLSSAPARTLTCGKVAYAGRGCGRRTCSKLRRQIAVDLEADTDLIDGRSCPSHGYFLHYLPNVGLRPDARI